MNQTPNSEKDGENDNPFMLGPLLELNAEDAAEDVFQHVVRESLRESFLMFHDEICRENSEEFQEKFEDSQADSSDLDESLEFDPIDPKDWEISVLTQFPDHTLPNTYLPLAYASHPLNSDNEHEFLIQIPHRRDFRVQIKYVGSETYDATEKCVYWEIYLNGLLIDNCFRTICPNSRTYVFSECEIGDMMYPLMFDSVKSSQEDSPGEKIDLERGHRLLNNFGLKIVGMYAVVTGTCEEKRDTFANIEMETMSDVWKPVAIDDFDTKRFGAKGSFGEPVPVKPWETRECSMYEEFPSSKITYTIRFCNSLNMTHWARNWNTDIEKIYVPYPYEAQLPLPPVISIAKRTMDEVIDLDPDEPTLKKTKTSEYKAWTASRVGEWLRMLDPAFERLGFVKIFESEAIDGSCLDKLDDIRLKELKIEQMGYRIRILKAIEELTELS